MTVTTSPTSFVELMLLEVEGELTDRPASLGDVVTMPQTHADIVRGMLPVDFSSRKAHQERQRLVDAIAFMRRSDRERLMNTTGLRNPFSGSPLAA